MDGPASGEGTGTSPAHQCWHGRDRRRRDSEAAGRPERGLCQANFTRAVLKLHCARSTDIKKVLPLPIITMDAKIHLWLVMALMSIAAYSSIDSCSCVPNHPQRAFCNSGLVIRAKFLGATFTDMVDEYYGNYSLIQYDIETLEVFKGGSEIQHLKFIYTATLYYCEYYVSPDDYNKDYWITGEMQNGRLDVIHCNYIVPWSQLSEPQKKGIEGAYSCDCKICHSYECSDITSKYCEFNGHYPWKMDLDSEYSDQENKDQMCAPNEYGDCTWRPVGTLLSTSTTSELKTTE